MKVFPPSRLDTANQCLWRRADTGQEARSLLTPKAFAVLEHLVEHAGRLVTHDEMFQAVRYLELKFCYKTLKRQAASLSYS
jgi:DNA-binding response OmpR family regulator